MRTLPPEWAEQDAVLFVWPDRHTDWVSNLDEAQKTYTQIFEALLPYSSVLLLVEPASLSFTKEKLHHLQRCCAVTTNLYFVTGKYDDTWVRDFGPISIQADEGSQLLDFEFNGWGNKFSASKDNGVSRNLCAANLFNKSLFTSLDFVLEGGAIDSDGAGSLLTTASCLLNPNRNAKYNREKIDAFLCTLFGVNDILWLNSGYLAGDDTDGHIDTLARFAPGDAIVYVQCTDDSDEHFSALNTMEAEIKRFKTQGGEEFQLIPLPLPLAQFNSSNERLPATYANFLVSNGLVLVPVYQDENDALALDQLQKAFPNHCIAGVDCRALIQQGGSLHCVSMQLNRGVLNKDTLNSLPNIKN